MCNHLEGSFFSLKYSGERRELTGALSYNCALMVDNKPSANELAGFTAICKNVDLGERKVRV